MVSIIIDASATTTTTRECATTTSSILPQRTATTTTDRTRMSNLHVCNTREKRRTRRTTTLVRRGSDEQRPWCIVKVCTVIVMVALSIAISPSNASYHVMEELIWSSEACEHQGLENEFDVCASLEFCQGTNEFGTSDSFGGGGNYYNYGGFDYGGASGGGYNNMDGDPMGMDMDYNNPMMDSTSASGTTTTPKRPTEGLYGFRIGGTSGCSTPGPTIRLRQGIRYGLFLNNTATDELQTDQDGNIVDERLRTTNLHTHGLHISGMGNADDVTRHVKPSEISIYNLTIPTNHMGGTFWYHSHMHGVVRDQVAGGAFGMLVVEDDLGNIGTDDTNVHEFLQNDIALVVDNIRDSVGGSGSNRMTLNGMTHNMRGISEDTQIDVMEGTWYRLRILHVNVDSHKSGVYIEFPSKDPDSTCDVRPIAHDGILKFQVPGESQSKYFLSSSSRLDVAIKCRMTGGDEEQLEIYADVNPIGTLNVVKKKEPLEIEPSPFVSDNQIWNTYRPNYLQDLSYNTNIHVDNEWTVNVYETSINEISYSLDKPLCDSEDNPSPKDFIYGTIQEWTLRGTMGHPFHVHMFPMQVVQGCGSEHEVGEYYDTIVVQNTEDDEDEDICVVRLSLINLIGHTMMHCHILQHEDQGAMGFINVVVAPSEDTTTSNTDLLIPPPQYQPSIPRVLKCSSDECDEPKQVTYCEDTNASLMSTFLGQQQQLMEDSSTSTIDVEESIVIEDIVNEMTTEDGTDGYDTSSYDKGNEDVEGDDEDENDDEDEDEYDEMYYNDEDEDEDEDKEESYDNETDENEMLLEEIDATDSSGVLDDAEKEEILNFVNDVKDKFKDHNDGSDGDYSIVYNEEDKNEEDLSEEEEEEITTTTPIMDSEVENESYYIGGGIIEEETNYATSSSEYQYPDSTDKVKEEPPSYVQESLSTTTTTVPEEEDAESTFDYEILNDMDEAEEDVGTVVVLGDENDEISTTENGSLSDGETTDGTTSTSTNEPPKTNKNFHIPTQEEVDAYWSSDGADASSGITRKHFVGGRDLGVVVPTILVVLLAVLF